MCRERGVLFVADEVICGFGRVGDWFASTRYGLEPDLTLVAKGITSGYVPLGAVLAAPSVWEPFWSRAGVWRHGYTYSGHAVAAPRPWRTSTSWPPSGCRNARWASRRCWPRPSNRCAAVPESPTCGPVRGCSRRCSSPTRRQVPALVAALRERQVLTRGIVTGSLQISPSLVIEERQITQLVEAITDALGALEQAA